MENAVAWIRFQQTFGRGSTRGQDLLTRLGHPCALFEMSGNSLAASSLLKPREVERLQGDGSEEKAQEILERCHSLGFDVLTPDDEGYPQRLREVYGCPAALYLRGSLAGLDTEVHQLRGAGGGAHRRGAGQKGGGDCQRPG